MVSRTRTRETTSPSSRAYKHVLARPPALPREHTNTYSRDHQPFLASRQTRTRESTSPSSRADQHVLARPPGLPRVHTNTYSRESCESLARLSHERVKLLVSGTVGMTGEKRTETRMRCYNTLCIPCISLHDSPYSHIQCMQGGVE